MNYFLIQSIAIPFYKKNTGFFFVVLYVCFGLIRSNEHIAFANLLAQQPRLTVVVLICWVFYFILVQQSLSKTLHSSSYVFFRQIALLKKAPRLLQLFPTALVIALPPTAYGCFLLLFSIQQKGLYSAGILVVFLLVSMIGVAYYLSWRVTSPLNGKNSNQRKYPVKLQFNKPWYTWYLFSIMDNGKLLFWMTKLLSCALLLAIYRLYPTGTYDQRLLLLGILFAGYSQIMLVFDFWQFNQQYNVLQLMGLQKQYRSRQQLFFFIVAVIPELIIIIYFHPPNLAYILVPGNALFLVSLLFSTFTWIRKVHPDREALSKTSFYLGAIHLIAILFGIPGWGLALLHGAWSYFTSRSTPYHRSEKL